MPESIVSAPGAPVQRAEQEDAPTDLTGRVALVTGASGGLGHTICLELERRGASVVRIDITGQDSLHFDASTAEGCQGMVSHALDAHGQLDILVLNAGVQHVAPIAEFPPEEWDRIMNLHMKGPFLALKAAWSSLTRQPGGRVIVTASTSSFVAEKFKAAYIASRHGVLGLVKVAALEGAEHGLTVNAVAPAWMRTPAVEAQVPNQMALRGLDRTAVLTHMLGRQPVARFVETQEVAAVVGFLASPAASGVNGACVPVDLGTLAW